MKERLHEHVLTWLTEPADSSISTLDSIVGECFMTISKSILTIDQVAILTTSDNCIMNVYTHQNGDIFSDCINKVLNIDFKSSITNNDVYTCHGKTRRIFGKDYIVHLISRNEQLGSINRQLDLIITTLSDIIQLYSKFNIRTEKVLHALDHIDDALTVCDQNGKIVYMNKQAYKMLDAIPGELEGQSISSFSDNQSMMSKVMESKRKVIDKEYFLRIYGKTLHLTTSAYPIFDDQKKIIGAIDLLQSVERTRKLANSIAGHEALYTFDEIVGKSSHISEAIEKAKAYANYNENILIIGDSGTGKELFSQSIHNYSSRKDYPFVAINCASFPNELIDSELFGYEEGSFTGAKKGGKQGKFELANNGTLFLDEIGEMPVHLQAKLLRVLETKKVNRIGSSQPISINVRIIAATNRDLENQVKLGNFRKDLYFRLKVLYLKIPSLNERIEDIELLANHFVRKTVYKASLASVELSRDAISHLKNIKWEGNIRELENGISRAVYLCNDRLITTQILIEAGITNSQPVSKIKSSNRIEISPEYLREIYAVTNGNKKRMSEILEISRPTLYKLLREHKIIK